MMSRFEPPSLNREPEPQTAQDFATVIGLSVTSVLATFLPDHSSLSGVCEIFRVLENAEVGWLWIVNWT
jgi:hypothetical protein